MNLVVVFQGFKFHSRHVFGTSPEANAFAHGFGLASGLAKEGMDLRAYFLDGTGTAAMRSVEDARQIERAYDAIAGMPT